MFSDSLIFWLFIDSVEWISHYCNKHVQQNNHGKQSADHKQNPQQQWIGGCAESISAELTQYQHVRVQHATCKVCYLKFVFTLIYVIVRQNQESSTETNNADQKNGQEVLDVIRDFQYSTHQMSSGVENSQKVKQSHVEEE